MINPVLALAVPATAETPHHRVPGAGLPGRAWVRSERTSGQRQFEWLFLLVASSTGSRRCSSAKAAVICCWPTCAGGSAITERWCEAMLRRSVEPSGECRGDDSSSRCGWRFPTS